MLRHRPEKYGVELDAGGWVPIVTVVAALARQSSAWADLKSDDIQAMMAAAEKRRFQIQDGRIRAVYGHSVPGKIAHIPSRPPALLFHGTTWTALESIRDDGLRPMRRQFVHLSPDIETADRVARRRTDDPAIIAVDAKRAHDEGITFYRTGDQTWLAGPVAARFLAFPDR